MFPQATVRCAVVVLAFVAGGASAALAAPGCDARVDDPASSLAKDLDAIAATSPEELNGYLLSAEFKRAVAADVLKAWRAGQIVHGGQIFSTASMRPASGPSIDLKIPVGGAHEDATLYFLHYAPGEPLDLSLWVWVGSRSAARYRVSLSL